MKDRIQEYIESKKERVDECFNELDDAVDNKNFTIAIALDIEINLLKNMSRELKEILNSENE